MSSKEEITIKHTLDKLLEGMQIIGFDWRYLFVNNALAAQSHYTKEELIGHTMMEMYPGIEKTELFGVLTLCMKDRISKHLENEFIYPDNTKSWFELSIQPVPEGIFILSVDITQRKLVEEKLIASEHKYHSLIEQATDGIFISDKTGKYTDANLSGCEMLGYSKEELLKMSVQDLLLKEDIINAAPKFDELLSGKTILTKRSLIRKDGSIVPVEINAKMLSSGEMLGMVRDITERKAADEKLKSSETKFRNLTETAFDAIILMDEAGEIIFWNHGASLIFGYSEQEVLQKRLTLIMPERYSTAHQLGIQRYLKTGEEKVMGKVVELEGKRKSGEVFPIEISITSWESNGKKVFSGIIRDISERKKSENRILKLNEDLEQKVIERTAQLEFKIKQLSESEEKFQKAYQSSAAGIAITRLFDSTYMDVNDSFAAMTGFSKEELIGHSSAELNLVIDLTKRQDVLDQVRARGYVRDVEMTVHSKTKKIIEVLGSIDVILLNDEKCALNIFYDITERKKAERQLKEVNEEFASLNEELIATNEELSTSNEQLIQSNEKLESANRIVEESLQKEKELVNLKNRFVSMASHEFRTPLTSISLAAGMIKKYKQKYSHEQIDEKIDGISSHIEYMSALLDDILVIGKADAGSISIHLSDVDPVSFCKNLISEIELNLKTHKVYGHFSCSKNIIHTDAKLFRNILTNLLTNAIKFSPGALHVDFELTCDPIFLNIKVKDYGIGIPAEDTKMLFNPFFRASNADIIHGTGLGLAIIKRAVDLLEGTIDVKSELGNGTEFTIKLPINS